MFKKTSPFLVCCWCLGGNGSLVLDELVGEDQEFLEINMIILVGVELLHGLGDVFGMELFADDAEERLELGGVDGAVAVLVERVKALPEGR